MRKYYTRPCNFYYGNYAKKLITSKKALPLTGNLNIAFDQIEIFERKKDFIKSMIFIHDMHKLGKTIKINMSSECQTMETEFKAFLFKKLGLGEKRSVGNEIQFIVGGDTDEKTYDTPAFSSSPTKNIQDDRANKKSIDRVDVPDFISPDK